jgi:hypothetical protein
MPSKNPLDIYSYYQLETCIAGNWEPVPGYVYSTTDFRLLLDTMEKCHEDDCDTTSL